MNLTDIPNEKWLASKEPLAGELDVPPGPLLDALADAFAWIEKCDLATEVVTIPRNIFSALCGPKEMPVGTPKAEKGRFRLKVYLQERNLWGASVVITEPLEPDDTITVRSMQHRTLRGTPVRLVTFQWPTGV